ncbi:MAG: hypothetical protein ACT4OI_08240 [Methanobacteriota archaeon]
MTLEGYEGERRLLSYDASGCSRTTAVAVCRIVFGRVRRDGHGSLREEGMIHRPGVVWIGQSVLVLPPSEAEALSERLRGLGVRVASGFEPKS